MLLFSNVGTVWCEHMWLNTCVCNRFCFSIVNFHWRYLALDRWILAGLYIFAKVYAKCRWVEFLFRWWLAVWVVLPSVLRLPPFCQWDISWTSFLIAPTLIHSPSPTDLFLPITDSILRVAYDFVLSSHLDTACSLLYNIYSCYRSSSCIIPSIKFSVFARVYNSLSTLASSSSYASCVAVLPPSPM